MRVLISRFIIIKTVMRMFRVRLDKRIIIASALVVGCLVASLVVVYFAPFWTLPDGHVVSISTLPQNSVAVSASVSYQTGSATASSGTIIGVTTQSTTTLSEAVKIDGYLYRVVESPECYPQCLMPSFILTYLYVPPGAGCTGSMACYPPPRYYRLLNTTGSGFWTTASNGTYTTVTGLLVIPSAWSCNPLYVPTVCMSGDIYVQNVTYT